MCVETVRGEDAGGDGGPRAALADRDGAPVAREVGLAEREQPVRDVATPGDVARVPLVLLADVDQLGPVREHGVQLPDREELERLGASSEHVPGDLEEPDGAKAARRDRSL